MRRHTKELVDAVAGEGKFRTGKDAAPAPTDSAKSNEPQPAAEPHPPHPSPLAEKGLSAQADSDPIIITDRRKRRSSMLTTADSTKESVDNEEETETPETSISSATSAESSSFDVYDFPGNSPSKSNKSKDDSESNRVARKSRAGRRSSALHDLDLDFELPERPKSAAARKRDRASMNVLRVDDSINEGVVGTRGRGRRNSTML
jgi:hypothetical protein